ncbi:virulence protein RhuM/Fic/DOC family protein [Candidatus Kaiserbacteria bacterium]|nr:MAG: virulence protein RhuM/Fic/DOC family protein [Candidatus Kaiserbacteria bacterium]
MHKTELVLFRGPSGDVKLRGDFRHDTVWATQQEIADVFGVERSVITKHIGNLFKSDEIAEKSNVQKMHIANSDKPISLYSLDIILAVGYRTNSVTAIRFRQWATKTLREHITKGYTINKKLVGKNYDAFMKSVADVQALLPEHVTLDPKSVLELIKEFATTWVSLDAYDKGTLVTKGVTRKKVTLLGSDLDTALQSLKTILMKKGEATELFANERSRGALEGIVGNVMQSFGGKPVYPTLEEKAAHLLYFVIKNHPFSDGNKRSGAFAFVWLLKKAGARGASQINPAALTALTLLIAESDPEKKDQMVALVTQMLR